MDAKIKDYMTESPHSIRPGEKLTKAKDMMDEYQIRHLPVVEKGKVVGLISERDFALLDLYPDMDLDNTTVENLMMLDVQTCYPDSFLHEVTAKMAQTKQGSAVVTDPDGTLRGIFTSIDALLLISRLYESK